MINYDNIKDNIPLFSISLFFISIIRLHFFYKFFGLNIIPYLTISEVIKSILDIGIVVVVSVIIYLFVDVSQKLRLEQPVSENNRPDFHFGIWMLLKGLQVATLSLLIAFSYLFSPRYYEDKITVVLIIAVVINFAAYLFARKEEFNITDENKRKALKWLDTLSKVILLLDHLLK